MRPMLLALPSASVLLWILWRRHQQQWQVQMRGVAALYQCCLCWLRLTLGFDRRSWSGRSNCGRTSAVDALLQSRYPNEVFGWMYV